MKALANIPKVLTQVEDLRGQQNIEFAFEEYKKNVRIFVKNMKEEVSKMIDGYEQTIAELRRENARLKGSPSNQFTRTKPSVISTAQNSSPSSPRKNQQVGTILNTMNTAKSKIFNSARDRSLEQLRLSPIFQKINLDHTHNNPEGQPFEKQPSRFEVKNKRKKHREQELRYFLECGNKSMNFTTEKFIEAIGAKNKKQAEQIQPIINNFEEKELDDNQSCMNKSLGNICNSLDTSYISKKARSQKKKRSHQIQNEAQMKKRQDAATTEMLKKKGIKSLLQRLRENVDASPSQKVQAITTSRFFAHHKEEQPLQNLSTLKKSSKVMINPVPIDIQKKAKATKKEHSANSSPVKPHSILKQSTVLTRSISGISAIQFDL